MFYEGRYKTQDYFLYFLYLFSVPSLIFSKKLKGAYFCLPSKDSLNYSISLFKGWFHLWSLFSTKCFLFVYMYIDLFKLKAYKLFEKKVMHTSPGFFFKEANLFVFGFRLSTMISDITLLLINT